MILLCEIIFPKLCGPHACLVSTLPPTFLPILFYVFRSKIQFSVICKTYTLRIPFLKLFFSSNMHRIVSGISWLSFSSHLHRFFSSLVFLCLIWILFPGVILRCGLWRKAILTGSLELIDPRWF